MERFLSYDRIISYHRNKLDVSPFPEDKLNMAYGDNKYQQFLIHLNQTDLEMIKKVIKEIDNQLQSGDEVYKYSIKHPELLDKLFFFLQYMNPNNKQDADIIRILSSQCFKQFCLVLRSKEHLNSNQFIKDIHNTFLDEKEEVRINVYQALIYYSQSRYGIDNLLENQILQQIIKMINEEKSNRVLNLILILTNEILNSEGAPQIALKVNLIENLKKYLNSEDLTLRHVVLINYGSISFCEEGKKMCVEEGSLIKMILKFLKLENYSKGSDKNALLKILVASTRFLNNVSILKRGKVEIFEEKGLDLCFDLIKNFDDEQLYLNIFGIIGNVSEEPRARKNMINIWEHLECFVSHENPLIAEQAQITKDIIKWKP